MDQVKKHPFSLQKKQTNKKGRDSYISRNNGGIYRNNPDNPKGFEIGFRKKKNTIIFLGISILKKNKNKALLAEDTNIE